MRKLLLGAIITALAMATPVSALAGVSISIGISLPPPIVFSADPVLIVVPDTNVYVAPDLDDDLFFWNGWWWRPWEGRWYRSHYHNRGWSYYNSVPSFYYDVDPGWRGYYRAGSWYGHRWNYERIPNQHLQQNWKSWTTHRYWERKKTWGVQNYNPRPQQQKQELRHQRQEYYQQRPEVQHYQQQRQVQQPPRERQQYQPQVEQPQRQHYQPQAEQPQRQQRQPQAEQPHGRNQGESHQQRSRGKSDDGDNERRR